MRKVFKFILTLFLSVFAITFLTLGVIFILPPKIELDEKKLITTSDFISFYDSQNNLITISDKTALNEKLTVLNTNLQNAFIAIEDKNFFKHKGVDYKRIIKASLVNIKNRAFKQGASTISQQLIKNTHLSNEKTLSRKITEIKLTKKLEKQYAKQEILTMYLNTIYFGENCFGVTSASKRYFDKTPDELTLSECASLAGTISAPSKLNPCVNLQANLKKRNLVLDRMLSLGLITESQYQTAIAEKLSINQNKSAPYSSYLNCCFDELSKIERLSPYLLKNCKVLTYYNSALQNYIYNISDIDCDYQNIVLDNKTCGVIAYHTTCGEIGREIASTAKPIAVYGPAIDKGIITPYTKINDEKTTFGDYSPSNFNDKYYGEVSVEFALNKSLNLPAVKVLDYLGVNTAKAYLNKMNIPCDNHGLSVALGNFSANVLLKDLAGSYTTFANLGVYKKPHFIKEIVDENGNSIYKAEISERRVFKKSTASLISDMLKKSTTQGTAKKLSYIDFDLAVKTGTLGTKNGNSDCYSVGYTTQNTFAVWIGNFDGSLLDNNQTGSNLPTDVLGQTVSFLYKNNKPSNFCDEDLVSVKIDKLTYDATGELLLANSNTPEKHTLTAKFAVDNQPKNYSTAFSSPLITDLSTQLNDNSVVITFTPALSTNAQIYRVFNGNKVYLGTSDGQFEDKLTEYGVYEYIIVPFSDGNETVYGQEIKSGKINYNKKGAHDGKPDVTPDDWWID